MNRWQVITGAPASGKTTTLAVLEQQGYRVIPETARVVIDEGIAAGLTAAELRADEQRFQRQVLARKQALERSLQPGEVIFFDRGIHDSLAYHRLHGHPVAEAQAAAKAAYYQRVFLLDRLPWTQDYARTEDDTQAGQLDQLLETAYREYGYEVVRIPVAAAADRVAAILARL